MHHLKAKTRGGTTANSKPRVFFCCHPEDFDLYFEPVANDILKLANCSIWYTEDPERYAKEDFARQLSDIQLFVMPVTRNLIHTKNAAADILFPFAIDQHIAVLPLMYGEGLEKEFNSRFGDLQFLTPYSADSTALPYKEKLSTYLSAVLVGDALAEKIRNAFDAYVFLSYRKKDREHAKHLMHLIHKNEQFRNIAIWYDEFLNPGEDFNTSIREALHKCGLFMLAVTPGVVEQVTEEDGSTHDNYIVEKEYPMATDAGKPVLPAEVVPTDKALLSQKYKNLPDCFDAHNEQELVLALSDAFRHIALRRNDSSPFHNFCIGMAYLKGIDVEVDVSRAVSLITEAANQGLPEAMQQLIVMYETGSGVPQSIKAVLKWQNRYIAYLSGTMEPYPSQEDTEHFFRQLFHLGDIYAQMKNTEKAQDTYKQAAAYLRDSLHYKDPHIQLLLTHCHDRLGGLLKDPMEQGKYYHRAFKQLQRVAETLKTPEVLFLQANNFCRLAGICFALDHEEGLMVLAERLGNISLEIDSGMDASFRLSMVDAYRGLAEEAKENGKTELSVFLFGEVQKILLTLAEEGQLSGTISHNESALAGISEFLAKEHKDKNPDLAISYYETAIRYYEKSEEEQDALISCLAHLAFLYRDAKKNYQKAISLILRAIALHEVLYDDNSPTVSRRYAALLHDALGFLYFKEKMPKEGYKAFQRELELRYLVAQEEETDVHMFELAKSLYVLGMHTPDTERKLSILQSADSVLEEAFKAESGQEEYQSLSRKIKDAIKTLEEL